MTARLEHVHVAFEGHVALRDVTLDVFSADKLLSLRLVPGSVLPSGKLRAQWMRVIC